MLIIVYINKSSVTIYKYDKSNLHDNMDMEIGNMPKSYIHKWLKSYSNKKKMFVCICGMVWKSSMHRCDNLNEDNPRQILMHLFWIINQSHYNMIWGNFAIFIFTFYIEECKKSRKLVPFLCIFEALKIC